MHGSCDECLNILYLNLALNESSKSSVLIQHLRGASRICSIIVLQSRSLIVSGLKQGVQEKKLFCDNYKLIKSEGGGITLKEEI